MESSYDFDDIEEYVLGNMSETDQRAFEASMAQNPALAAQVEALRLEPKVLELLREEARRKQFAIWEAELAAETRAMPAPPIKPQIEPQKKSIRRFLLATLAVAASVLLLLLAYRILHPVNTRLEPEVADQPMAPVDTTNQPGTSPGPTDKNIPERTLAKQWSPGDYRSLANRYYDTSPNLSGIRSANNVSDSSSSYSRSVLLYERQDYQEALALLRNPDSAQLQKYIFLRAQIAYRADSIDQALADFRFLKGADNGQKSSFAPFHYEAQWGEVLCLVTRLPKSSQTVHQLLTAMLKRPSHPYRAQAAKLLKEQALQDALSPTVPTQK